MISATVEAPDGYHAGKQSAVSLQMSPDFSGSQRRPSSFHGKLFLPAAPGSSRVPKLVEGFEAVAVAFPFWEVGASCALSNVALYGIRVGNRTSGLVFGRTDS